jgi:hypothetical protein
MIRFILMFALILVGCKSQPHDEVSEFEKRIIKSNEEINTKANNAIVILQQGSKEEKFQVIHDAFITYILTKRQDVKDALLANLDLFLESYEELSPMMKSQVLKICKISDGKGIEQIKAGLVEKNTDVYFTATTCINANNFKQLEPKIIESIGDTSRIEVEVRVGGSPLLGLRIVTYHHPTLYAVRNSLPQTEALQIIEPLLDTSDENLKMTLWQCLNNMGESPYNHELIRQRMIVIMSKGWYNDLYHEVCRVWANGGTKAKNDSLKELSLRQPAKPGYPDHYADSLRYTLSIMEAKEKYNIK